MPVFSKSQLEDIAHRILSGANVPSKDAQTVAEELALANEVGHDSHGVIRLMQYVDMIRQEFVVAGATIETVRSGGAFSIIDANFNFGQVAGRHALQTGLSLARTTGTGTVMIRNCNHVGRLGS